MSLVDSAYPHPHPHPHSLPSIHSPPTDSLFEAASQSSSHFIQLAPNQTQTNETTESVQHHHNHSYNQTQANQQMMQTTEREQNADTTSIISLTHHQQQQQQQHHMETEPYHRLHGNEDGRTHELMAPDDPSHFLVSPSAPSSSNNSPTSSLVDVDASRGGDSSDHPTTHDETSRITLASSISIGTVSTEEHAHMEDLFHTSSSSSSTIASNSVGDSTSLAHANLPSPPPQSSESLLSPPLPTTVTSNEGLSSPPATAIVPMSPENLALVTRTTHSRLHTKSIHPIMADVTMVTTTTTDSDPNSNPNCSSHLSFPPNDPSAVQVNESIHPSTNSTSYVDSFHPSSASSSAATIGHGSVSRSISRSSSESETSHSSLHRSVSTSSSHHAAVHSPPSRAKRARRAVKSEVEGEDEDGDGGEGEREIKIEGDASEERADVGQEEEDEDEDEEEIEYADENGKCMNGNEDDDDGDYLDDESEVHAPHDDLLDDDPDDGDYDSFASPTARRKKTARSRSIVSTGSGSASESASSSPTRMKKSRASHHTSVSAQVQAQSRAHTNSHRHGHGHSHGHTSRGTRVSLHPPSSLDMSTVVCDANGLYVCPMCQKTFTRNSNLTRHFRIHEAVKRFECPSCSKTFMEKHHLDAHLRVHTGLRPYSCPKCARSFTDRSNATRHIRTHGPEYHSVSPKVTYRRDAPTGMPPVAILNATGTCGQLISPQVTPSRRVDRRRSSGATTDTFSSPASYALSSPGGSSTMGTPTTTSTQMLNSMIISTLSPSSNSPSSGGTSHLMMPPSLTDHMQTQNRKKKHKIDTSSPTDTSGDWQRRESIGSPDYGHHKLMTGGGYSLPTLAEFDLPPPVTIASNGNHKLDHSFASQSHHHHHHHLHPSHQMMPAGSPDMHDENEYDSKKRVSRKRSITSGMVDESTHSSSHPPPQASLAHVQVHSPPSTSSSSHPSLSSPPSHKKRSRRPSQSSTSHRPQTSYGRSLPLTVPTRRTSLGQHDSSIPSLADLVNAANFDEAESASASALASTSAAASGSGTTLVESSGLNDAHANGNVSDELSSSDLDRSPPAPVYASSSPIAKHDRSPSLASMASPNHLPLMSPTSPRLLSLTNLSPRRYHTTTATITTTPSQQQQQTATSFHTTSPNGSQQQHQPQQAQQQTSPLGFSYNPLPLPMQIHPPGPFSPHMNMSPYHHPAQHHPSVAPPSYAQQPSVIFYPSHAPHPQVHHLQPMYHHPHPHHHGHPHPHPIGAPSFMSMNPYMIVNSSPSPPTSSPSSFIANYGLPPTPAASSPSPSNSNSNSSMSTHLGAHHPQSTVGMGQPIRMR